MAQSYIEAGRLTLLAPLPGFPAAVTALIFLSAAISSLYRLCSGDCAELQELHIAVRSTTCKRWGSLQRKRLKPSHPHSKEKKTIAQ